MKSGPSSVGVAMTQRHALLLSVLTVSTTACTPEVWSDHEGPLITLSEAHPTVEYQVVFCLDGEGYEHLRPLDAWAHLEARGEGDWSIVASNETHGPHAYIDYAHWERYDSQLGLRVNEAWEQVDDRHCTLPQLARFTLDRAPESGNVNIDWQIHFGVEELAPRQTEGLFSAENMEVVFELYGN